jgi:hypothetical protein
LERVTGIEPALSAWEYERSGVEIGLACENGCPLSAAPEYWLWHRFREGDDWRVVTITMRLL